ncbi:hypothetical protein ACFU0X_10285 [Streptomyces cellulosae]|uniref:Uncharacterized protein n=1 Tax=Streptomyces cellulosae TaxID=1968 RepID=A0ABW6JEB4_STRCE
MRVEPPLHAEGTGTARDEWVLSLRYKGRSGGEALALLLCENVGPGLMCNEGGTVRAAAVQVAAARGAVALAAPGRAEIMAKISTDAGNLLRFGSDDGLLVTGAGGEGPSPSPCGKSIASLPETGVVGAYIVAGLHHPFNSPQGLQYCINNNVDITHVRTAATADGVAWLAEYESGNVAYTRSSLYVSSPASQLDSDTIAATWNRCGYPDNPRMGVVNTIDGGWYGWLAPQYLHWFLPEFLERANGKTVVLADCIALQDEGSIVSEAANVEAVLRAGKQACAQQWLLVGVEQVANARTVIANGFTPIMMPMFAKERVKWGETKAPYTVEELTGAGVKWIGLTEKYADSVFEAYKAAGLSVLMIDNSRHYVQERADRLARGRLNMDPVYARGVEKYDYRRQAGDPWERKRMALGQLSHATDNYEVTGVDPRGYTKNDSSADGVKNGLVLPPGFGQGRSAPSLLVGYRCPIPDPEGTYTISWDMQVESMPAGTGNGPKIGILFCATSDRQTMQWEQDDPERNPVGWPKHRREMYRAFWRVNSGALGLGKWDETHTWSSTEVASTKPVANQWVSFEVKVTPDSISFTRKGSGGKTVTLEDSTWRGPYIFIEKEELHPGDEKYQFRAGFRRVVVSS